MKSLEQELTESKTKFEELSITKHVVDDKHVYVLIKPKDDKVYISHFKRNHKENIYFARLDKCKSYDVDAKVSKPMFEPISKLQKKFASVRTCHLCWCC